jgi:hypothetical protein
MNIYILHWAIALILLCISFFNYFYVLVRWIKFYVTTKHNTDYLLVFFSLVFSDFILLFNYIPFYASSLINTSIPSDFGCFLSAFTIIMNIVAYNGSVITISIYIYFLIVRETKIRILYIILLTTFWWLLGLLISLYYYYINTIGNYKDLYCCVWTKYEVSIAIPIFTCFFLSSVIMFFCYLRAYYHVKKYNVLNDNKHWSVAKRGIIMITCYYLAWFYVSLNAIMDLNDISYSLWNDIIASWFIKLSPITNSFIFSNILNNVYNSVSPKFHVNSNNNVSL